jgi:DNA mismatch repair protein MutS2
VIQAARSHVSEDTNQIDKMIASLESSKRQAEIEQEEARDYLRQAEKLHQDMQKQMIEFYENKDSMLEKAAEQAGEILEEAKSEAEKVIRDLRKMRIEKQADIKEHELIDAKRRLEAATPEITKSSKLINKKSKKHTFTPGDEVKVLTFGQKGSLLEKVSDNEWQVQIGILKMKVKEKDLEYISTPKPVETRPMAIVQGRDADVKLELDLRGERYEAALFRVEKYIDDALLSNYPRVSIIHGKGTGALRQGVQEYLRNHRSVKKIRFGEAGEGGSGVTVVEFK